MDPKKKRACEGIQALMLQNELQKDYLEAALDAAVNDDYDAAEMYMHLVAENDNKDLNGLMAIVRGDVRN